MDRVKEIEIQIKKLAKEKREIEKDKKSKSYGLLEVHNGIVLRIRQSIHGRQHYQLYHGSLIPTVKELKNECEKILKDCEEN